MDNGGKPYTDKDNIRTFSQDVEEQELVWHRDHNTRLVEVKQGKGWQIQLDNKLPITLKEGEAVVIPKETYHRLLKGTTDLVVEITEYES